MSKVNRTIGVLVAAATLTFGFVSPALATPPNIPSVDTARSELASLTVASEGSSSGYSRDLFPHWITQSGACNTREVVLKRDGTNVVTDSACAATSGTWKSPYDGGTWTLASDVDIDHVVPLSEAWKSGGVVVDDVPAPVVRERPVGPAAHRGHRQREPGQGRQGPGRVEATADDLLLHVRQDVGSHEEKLGTHPAKL